MKAQGDAVSSADNDADVVNTNQAAVGEEAQSNPGCEHLKASPLPISYMRTLEGGWT